VVSRVVCSRKPWFRLGNWLLVAEAEAERRARVEVEDEETMDMDLDMNTAIDTVTGS
jgi:hypothetical protein